MGKMKLVVSPETGEVLTEINPGDRIIRKKSVEYLQTVKEWKIDHFYKGYLPEIRQWMKELTPYEKALLFTVSPYVGYEDCCLKHDNGHMLRFKDMVEMSCMPRSSTAKALRGLVSKDIIYRGKNSKEMQYFINPWLFCKGHRINTVLQTMFRNYKIRVCQNIKWGNLKEV